MKKLILVTASILAMTCSPITASKTSAQDAVTNQSQHGKIYVTATGSATQAPDQARVSAGVVTQAATAGEAMRTNAVQMNAAFMALEQAGIQKRDITTSQMSLQPQYDYQNRQAPRITGYEVRNTVSAKSHDLEKVGPMLDALVSAGVNNINGVSFSIKDAKAAKAKARADAIAQAKIKAEQMVAAAGVRLGRVLEIRESSVYNAPEPRMMMARNVAADTTTPVATGEQTLSVTVSLTYAIN